MAVVAEDFITDGAYVIEHTAPTARIRDETREFRVRGNDADGDVQQFVQILFDESGGFKSRYKHLGINGFSGMVDLPVQLADAGGELRVACAQAGPNLCANTAAHALMVVVIVVCSGSRRVDATAEIAFEVGVFAWIVRDCGDEGFREIVGVEIKPELFDNIQPKDL